MKTISLRAALMSFGVGAVALSALAYAAGSLHGSTNKDLMDAMHGEAFANVKYMAYADAARAHGNPQLGDLFERTANVERQQHFAEHAKLAGLVGSDADNLRDAITGENYETTKMYPQMGRRADAAGNKAVAQHFREVGKDEANHRDTFKSALAKLEVKQTR
jgi:rubrerythrin